MKRNYRAAFFISAWLLFYNTPLQAQYGADSMLNFIQRNKPRSSLYFQKNGVVGASLNENKLMPLASTVKIMVAIEFAKQAAADVFDENNYVAVSDLNKYYVPNTDGDAHPNWLHYELQKGNIVNDSVKLIDVARGMMMFSSNANTEFLMDLLGFDNVKNNVQLLGLINHTTIYPIVSSLFLYQNPRKYKEDKILKEIDKLTDEDYCRFIYLIHNELKNDTSYKTKFRPGDLSEKMQKLWSDRLPSSTTKEYVRVGAIINNRKYFDVNTYGILAEVMETMMENPANQRLFLHAGMKGGSTIFALTKDLYATLKDGTKIEMAYFFNDLSPQENSKLQSWMSEFELSVLMDDNFRNRLKILNP